MQIETAICSPISANAGTDHRNSAWIYSLKCHRIHDSCLGIQQPLFTIEGFTSPLAAIECECEHCIRPLSRDGREPARIQPWFSCRIHGERIQQPSVLQPGCQHSHVTLVSRSPVHQNHEWGIIYSSRIIGTLQCPSIFSREIHFDQ